MNPCHTLSACCVDVWPLAQPADAERFARHVLVLDGPDACWLWIGALASDTGYGRFWISGRLVAAHRFAYTAAVGPITAPVVMHVCDIRVCVRPDHLAPGDQRQNMRDAATRGNITTRCRSRWPLLSYQLRDAARAGRADLCHAWTARPIQLTLPIANAEHPVTVDRPAPVPHLATLEPPG